MTIQIAAGRAKLSAETDNPVDNITPPEALVLEAIHRKGAGGQVLTGLTITGSRPYNARAEKERLISKYGGKVIEKIFPGNFPQFPRTFAEVNMDAGTVPETDTAGDVTVPTDADNVVEEINKLAEQAKPRIPRVRKSVLPGNSPEE